MDNMIIVNYPGRLGGGAAYAYEMTKALVENGNMVSAIISENIENLSKWEKLNLFKLYKIRTYRSNFSFIFSTIRFFLFERYLIKKAFNKYEIKCIYVPMIQPWTESINNIFYNRFKIVTVHDPQFHSGSDNYIMNYLHDSCAKAADKVIILSHTFKELTMRKYLKKEKDVYVIPHGDFKYYKENCQRKDLCDYPENKVNYIFFGRISKYKGIPILADAYRRVCEVHNDVSLTIAGSGDFSDFKSLFDSLPNVRVLNRWFSDEEVGNLFTGKNLIAVLPYIDATQSGVIPIAIEYEVPIIASDVGGLSEQITNGVTGILVPPKEPQYLAEAMISLYENKEQGLRLAQNALAMNHKNSWDEGYQKLKRIMDEL